MKKLSKDYSDPSINNRLMNENKKVPIDKMTLAPAPKTAQPGKRVYRCQTKSPDIEKKPSQK